MKTNHSVMLLKKAIVSVLVLSLLLCSFGTLGIFAQETASILTNGDFENGLTGYNYASTVTATVVTDADTSSNVSEIKSNAATPYGSQLFWQEVEVQANKTYVWKFSAKATNNSNSFVGVRSADGKTLLASNITCTASSCVDSSKSSFTSERDASQVGANWHAALRTGGASVTTWQDYTVTFYAGEHTTVLLSFNLWAGDRLFYVDNMTLAKAEEEVGQEFANGNFENDLTGYTYTENANFTVETVTDEKYDGEKALHLNVTGFVADYEALFYQAVKVEAGKTYEWKFWAKSDAAMDKNNLIGVRTANGLNLLPSSISCDTYPNSLASDRLSFDSLRPSMPYMTYAANWHQGIKVTNGWQEYTVTFETLAETTVLLTFNSFATGREIWVDNMSLDIVYHEFENGDFENELVGYEKTDATGFTAEIVTDTVHGGTNALHLKADSTATAGITNHMLWQTVAVEPNTAYKWTFYAKAGSGSNSMVGVRSVGTTELLPSAITTETGNLDSGTATNTTERTAATPGNWHQGVKNTNDWAKYTVTFETGDANNVLLTFNLFAAGRELWIDDMTLEAVYHEFENGDFENALTGYEKSNNDAFTTEVVADTENAENNVLHLKSTDTNSNFWQTAAVEANSTYKWTFYAKAGSETTAGTNTLVGVRSVYETELLPSNFTTETGEIATDRAIQSSKRSITVANNWHQGIRNTDDWAEYTVTFATGDATTVLLTFNLFAVGREIWVDNMTLAKAEELEVQIANNDFEVAVTDGALEGFGVSGIPTVLETVLDGENNVLHISGGEQGGTGAIYQKIIVMPNTDYVWSFKLKEMNVQEDSRSVISVFGADGTNLVNDNFSYSEIGSCSSWNTSWYATTDSQGWATFYFKFNSGDNCQVQLTHNAWTTARDTYIDDWSVVAIDDIVVGDGDGDGTLAAGDLVVLRQRLLNIPNTIDELSADINKDKALNLKDLVVLKKATVAK